MSNSDAILQDLFTQVGTGKASFNEEDLKRKKKKEKKEKKEKKSKRHKEGERKEKKEKPPVELPPPPPVPSTSFDNGFLLGILKNNHLTTVLSVMNRVRITSMLMNPKAITAKPTTTFNRL